MALKKENNSKAQANGIGYKLYCINPDGEGYIDRYYGLTKSEEVYSLGQTINNFATGNLQYSMGAKKTYPNGFHLYETLDAAKESAKEDQSSDQKPKKLKEINSVIIKVQYDKVLATGDDDFDRPTIVTNNLTLLEVVPLTTI